MASTKWLLTLSALAVATQASAAEGRMAPTGTSDTRYCMRIEMTGSLVERVKCWTRQEWADQGVDVDRDWTREGVRTVG